MSFLFGTNHLNLLIYAPPLLHSPHYLPFSVILFLTWIWNAIFQVVLPEGSTEPSAVVPFPVEQYLEVFSFLMHLWTHGSVQQEKRLSFLNFLEVFLAHKKIFFCHSDGWSLHASTTNSLWNLSISFQALFRFGLQTKMFQPIMNFSETFWSSVSKKNKNNNYI